MERRGAERDRFDRVEVLAESDLPESVRDAPEAAGFSLARSADTDDRTRFEFTGVARGSER